MTLKQFKIDFLELNKINNLLLTTRIKEYQQNYRSDFLPFSYFIDNNNIYSLGQKKKEEFQLKGEFPIIDQGQEFIAGYSDEADLVYSGKLPAIIFGDHTRIFKFVDFPFIQGADGIKIIKPNENIVNPKFFYYSLSKIGVPSRGYNRHFSILKKQKYPLIPKPIQDQIVAQIEPIEKKIKELKAQIKQPQETINKVFAREFGFDLEKFEELKKIKNYYLDLYVYSNNKDIRNSVIFHRESAQFVMNELKKVTNSKIKHYIAEPIVLGASISPSEFNENGEFYYISMATVKNYILELDDSQLISDDYSSKNLKKMIKKYDIIMTRSGVAIGKFALVEEEVKGIFADFTMRIRLKNCNPYFAYYYFRSEYFQYLIHSNKKGLQNKNIFPSQIQEFPMIDISLSRQQKIADEIKTELDKQKEIKQKMEVWRNKIDEIIEKAIT